MKTYFLLSLWGLLSISTHFSSISLENNENGTKPVVIVIKLPGTPLQPVPKPPKSPRTHLLIDSYSIE